MVYNLTKNIRNYETKLFFSYAKQLETLFFVFSYFIQFRKTIETRQNSDLFRSVSYFAKLKQNTKLSTLHATALSMAKSPAVTSYGTHSNNISSNSFCIKSIHSAHHSNITNHHAAPNYKKLQQNNLLNPLVPGCTLKYVFLF